MIVVLDMSLTLSYMRPCPAEPQSALIKPEKVIKFVRYVAQLIAMEAGLLHLAMVRWTRIGPCYASVSLTQCHQKIIIIKTKNGTKKPHNHHQDLATAKNGADSQEKIDKNIGLPGVCL